MQREGGRGVTSLLHAAGRRRRRNVAGQGDPPSQRIHEKTCTLRSCDRPQAK